MKTCAKELLSRLTFDRSPLQLLAALFRQLIFQKTLAQVLFIPFISFNVGRRLSKKSNVVPLLKFAVPFSSLGFLCVLFLFIIFGTFTETFASQEKLPIPRFASIKSNEVIVRSGPGSSYKILWIFVNKNEPVEIIEEFDIWRKIRDYEGAAGWVHSRMLSGKRHVIIKDPVSISNNASGLESGTSNKVSSSKNINSNKNKKLAGSKNTSVDTRQKKSQEAQYNSHKHDYSENKTQGFIKMHKYSSENSKVLAHIHYGARCQILDIDNTWCKLNCDKVIGWVQKSGIWGVYDAENSYKANSAKF